MFLTVHYFDLLPGRAPLPVYFDLLPGRSPLEIRRADPYGPSQIVHSVRQSQTRSAGGGKGAPTRHDRFTNVIARESSYLIILLPIDLNILAPVHARTLDPTIARAALFP
jgi:hypothetical protein